MIGKNITTLRKANKKSQTELAEYLGISQSAVSQLERGITNIDIETATRIATYFGVSVGELLDEEDSRGHIQESFVVDTSGSMSARSSSNIPTGEEAKQGMIAALEKEMAKYLVSQVDKRIAEATQILTAMTDEEYQMALNILRAMKK